MNKSLYYPTPQKPVNLITQQSKKYPKTTQHHPQKYWYQLLDHL